MSNVLIVAEHLNGKLNASTAKCVSAAQALQYPAPRHQQPAPAGEQAEPDDRDLRPGQTGDATTGIPEGL